MGDGELGTGSYWVDRCVSESAVAVVEEDDDLGSVPCVRDGNVRCVVAVEVGGGDSGGYLELIGWQFVVGGILNVPSPLPRRIETFRFWLESKFVTARSTTSSPSKSAVERDSGWVSAGKSSALANRPCA